MLIGQKVAFDGGTVDNCLGAGQFYGVLHESSHQRVQELVRNVAQQGLDIFYTTCRRCDLRYKLVPSGNGSLRKTNCDVRRVRYKPDDE
jgi:hypothetical protein